MSAINIDRIVSKLNSLVSNRFGVVVQFIPLCHPDPAMKAPLETVKRNSGAPMIVAHNELLIPVRIEGSLVGATRVKKINILQPRELLQVKETIDLVLTEALAAQSKLNLANARLDYMENLENKSNVFFLNRAAALAMEPS